MPPPGGSRGHTQANWTMPAVGSIVSDAERRVLDIVTIEDSLALQSTRYDWPADWTDLVRGRLDALLPAAWRAPVTQHIGLVPVGSTTHTEPFHVSKVVAALDRTSRGRAGWQVRVRRSAGEAKLFRDCGADRFLRTA